MINYHTRAVELLEKIANSVHERDSKNPNLLFFSISEVELVEDWLMKFDRDITNHYLKVQYPKENPD